MENLINVKNRVAIESLSTEKYRSWECVGESGQTN